MNRTEKIRVAVIDDNRLIGTLLRRELRRTSDIECVGYADAPEPSRRLVEDQRPEIALVDVFLPGRDGIGLAAELSTICPSMRIVMFTNMSLDSWEMLQLMVTSRREVEAWDFVSKIDDIDELLESIRSVALGHRRLYLEQALSDSGLLELKSAPRPRLGRPSFSATESYVLHMLGKGFTPEQIRGTRLEWSDKEHAVESHLRNIRNKLGVNTQLQIVLEAQRLGFIDPPYSEPAHP